MSVTQANKTRDKEKATTTTIYDLLAYRERNFVLWRVRNTDIVPRLIIGKFQPAQGTNAAQLTEQQTIAMRQSEKSSDLWEISAAECNLQEGQVYHYWFEVHDSNPYKAAHPLICCTDPLASTVDWRLLAPQVQSPDFAQVDRDPAGVIKFQHGRLVSCDPGGEIIDWSNDASPSTLPPNNTLVQYELPTRWARIDNEQGIQLSSGTFRDVLALIERDSSSPSFPRTAAFAAGRAYLLDLGINALELLPPADSFQKREWGYATSNYFSADFDLGFPQGTDTPRATTDLVAVVKACHRYGLRFFVDVVMAFATYYSYQNINFLDFHVQYGTGDPEGIPRDAFGGDLFKYNYWTTSYDPRSGETKSLVPARMLMLTYLARWMRDFRVDGIRMDSIPNIANWDFIQDYKDEARFLWHVRWKEQAPESNDQDADKRFLVVGEDMSISFGLLNEHRLDGLWNEPFKRRVRKAILGESDESDDSFETTIRHLIDCRSLGYQDGTQAINYITSHDVGGFGNERLYNYLNNNGVIETEAHIKLAFVCLLTAVGIPMILAGEEFADQHDLPMNEQNKQIDPVNFERLEEPWRKSIFDYVARLVHFRASSPALAVNDTHFIHTDFEDGKRVLVWQRGEMGSDAQVVVVANFSDYGTPDPLNPASEYRIPNWPFLTANYHWREITQDREVPVEWAGREPIYPWEAKVYTQVP
jgi:pullulanase